MESPQMIEKTWNGCRYYLCTRCNYLSLDKNLLTAHIDGVFGSIICQMNREKITCFGCTNSFYTKNSLLSHMIHDHQMSELDASILIDRKLEKSEQVGSRNKSQSKIKITSDVKISLPLPEIIADKQLLNVDTIEKKLKANRENKSKKKNIKLKSQGSKCSIENCSVKMLVNENIMYHEKCHNRKNNEDKFVCPECTQFSSNYWTSMASHLWRLHIIDMELHACDLCNFKTPSLSKLTNQHRGIHGDDRPFVCDSCGKGFKTSKQLRTHQTLHTENNKETAVECDKCQRIFKNNRLLKLHNNTIHNEYKPFKCNFCDYSASTRSVLRLHLRRHTGEKPFSCEQCSYSTGDHNSLRRHKLRHLKLKPYNCQLCSYACIQSSTFKVHLKNKHPGSDQLFSCKFCSFKSLNSGNLLTHVATKHQPQQQTEDEINKNTPTD